MERMEEVQSLSVSPEQPQSPKDGSGGGYCAVCGREGDPKLKRFGQLFCSEAHVGQYASEGRAKADLAVATAPDADAKAGSSGGGGGMACGMGTKGGLRKMGWCLAGGLGLLIAIPLIASGGLAATAGSLLSVAAFLACPIGMYFMMRAMMKMNKDQGPKDKGGEK